MNKIIYLRYLPLTQKVKEDFYMVELSQSGYVVEYWDITKMFPFAEIDVESYVPDEEESIRIVKIETKKDLNNKISQNQKALFVSIMTYEWRIVFLFKYLEKYHCRKAVFSYWPMPLHKIAGQYKRRPLGKRILNFKLNNLKQLFAGFFFTKGIEYGMLPMYDYCFYGGKEGWRGIGRITLDQLRKTKMFEVNNWDYDKFLKNKIDIKDNHYIVFLDEYYPFHPDILLIGVDKAPDAIEYYKDLDRAFSTFEDYYGMPVKIAAHPKAIKYKETNYFNGREVYFNKTLELVAGASLVLAHDSLSIGYAVMCNKPICFITSDEIKLKLPDDERTIHAFANYLESPLLSCNDINVRQLPSKIELTKEQLGIYLNMKGDYMSALNTGETNVELVKKYLEIIFREINNL